MLLPLLGPSLNCVPGGGSRLPRQGELLTALSQLSVATRAGEQGVLGLRSFLIPRISKQFSVISEFSQCRYCYTLQQGSGPTGLRDASDAARRKPWGGIHARSAAHAPHRAPAGDSSRRRRICV